MFLSFFFHLFLTESASHPLSRQAAGVARLRSGDICRKCGALSPSEHVSAVAQWLACWAHNPKVRGSKPRCAISRLSYAVRCFLLRFGWLSAMVLVEALGVSYFFSAYSLNQHPSLTPQSSILSLMCLVVVLCGLLVGLVQNAAGEDRTPDLRIMRPTRCQLRYRRMCLHCGHSRCPLFGSNRQ